MEVCMRNLKDLDYKLMDFNDDFDIYDEYNEFDPDEITQYKNEKGNLVNLRKTEWLTKDNKVIKMKDMTSSHLINCILFLRRVMGDAVRYNEKYKSLIRQAKFRGIIKLTNLYDKIQSSSN